jgi:DNA-binding NarL/FixJ family response regulator
LTRIIQVEGTALILTPREDKILRAFLHDGADTKTIAMRTGYTPGSCNNVLTEIAGALGMSRMAMIVSILRGRTTITVKELHGKRRDLAARRLALVA